MFVWQNNYSIGIYHIDEQHQGLFEIGNWLNELNLSDLKEDRYIEVMIILNDLLVYFHDHFKDEEDYMKSVNYPKLNDHKQGHQKFIDYIASFDQVDVCEQGEDLILRLFKFINNWIIHYIMSEDQMISSYVQSKMI